MVDPFADGQVTHLLSLLSGGRKRPFAVEMLAGIQSSHPQLMVKRHPHADRDEVHVGMLDHFVRVGKSVGDPEMPGRGPALHRVDRDALYVGGQARRRVVEAQEEAEEAHGFERQNRKREIDVCVFVSILLATSTVTMAATIVATGMPRVVDSLGGSAYYSCIFFAYWLAQCTMTVNSPSAHRHKPLRIPSPFDLDV
jgi:hypothetical protein